MDSSNLETLQKALAWLESGHAVSLFTVIETWGSAPRPPGSLLAVRDDARLRGSVSGGCLEEDLLERLDRGSVFDGPTALLRYGADAEERERFRLPCGGQLVLLGERLTDPAPLRAIVDPLERRRPVIRAVDATTGETRVLERSCADPVTFDGQRLIHALGPVWQLVLIGAGDVSRCVAEMARPLDYRIHVCDPRETYAGEWDVAGSELTTEMPDDFIRRLAPDERTAIITLAHDPKVDDMALMAALESPAFYVGALGSAATSRRRRDRLAELDIDPEAIRRLRAPVGLPIGSRTPAEIAISVLGEITRLRHANARRTTEGLDLLSHGMSEA